MNTKNSKAKRKRQAIVSVFLIVALIIGGAFAYLSATDSKTNVFTIGNVKLKLIEEFDKNLNGEIDEPDEVFDATDETVVMDPDCYLVPGQEVIKKPYVENTGSNDFRLYMSVQIPAVTSAEFASDNGELTLDEEQKVIVKAYAIQDTFDEDATVESVWEENFGGKDPFGELLDDNSVSRENVFTLNGVSDSWELVRTYQSVTDADSKAGYSCYVYAYKGTGNYLLAKGDSTENTPFFTSVTLNERIGGGLTSPDMSRKVTK